MLKCYIVLSLSSSFLPGELCAMTIALTQLEFNLQTIQMFSQISVRRKIIMNISMNLK